MIHDLIGGAVSPDTYLTLPDLGEQDALTVSMWVNIHDLQTRVSTDEPRVSTLLDTKTGGVASR